MATHFFCDFTFLDFLRKFHYCPGEILVAGGRGDLSGQLLLVASFDSGNFDKAKF